MFPRVIPRRILVLHVSLLSCFIDYSFWADGASAAAGGHSFQAMSFLKGSGGEREVIQTPADIVHNTRLHDEVVGGGNRALSSDARLAANNKNALWMKKPLLKNTKVENNDAPAARSKRKIYVSDDIRKLQDLVQGVKKGEVSVHYLRGFVIGKFFPKCDIVDAESFPEELDVDWMNIVDDDIVERIDAVHQGYRFVEEAAHTAGVRDQQHKKSALIFEYPTWAEIVQLINRVEIFEDLQADSYDNLIGQFLLAPRASRMAALQAPIEQFKSKLPLFCFYASQHCDVGLPVVVESFSEDEMNPLTRLRQGSSRYKSYFGPPRYPTDDDNFEDGQIVRKRGMCDCRKIMKEACKIGFNVAGAQLKAVENKIGELHNHIRMKNENKSSSVSSTREPSADDGVHSRRLDRRHSSSSFTDLAGNFTPGSTRRKLDFSSPINCCRKNENQDVDQQLYTRADSSSSTGSSSSSSTSSSYHSAKQGGLDTQLAEQQRPSSTITSSSSDKNGSWASLRNISNFVQHAPFDITDEQSRKKENNYFGKFFETFAYPKTTSYRISSTEQLNKDDNSPITPSSTEASQNASLLTFWRNRAAAAATGANSSFLRGSSSPATFRRAASPPAMTTNRLGPNSMMSSPSQVQMGFEQDDSLPVRPS